jgi:hypothetical protein
MVRHGVELHGGGASSEAITFTVICMEGAWVPSEADRFSCRFYTIRTESTHAAAKKDKVTVRSYQNILLASLLHQAR